MLLTRRALMSTRLSGTRVMSSAGHMPRVVRAAQPSHALPPSATHTLAPTQPFRATALTGSTT